MPPPLPAGLILGHRGSPAELPENTLGSFRRAVEAGAEGVELDVQPSADGVPVVIHDETVDRTTNGRGAVAALPWSALARLDAGAGERIPRLEEVAAWAAEVGAWLNVELKAPGAEAAALRAIREAGLLERTVFSSFHPAVVAEVGRIGGSARRFLLSERWNPRVRAALAESGAQGVCLKDRAATPAALRELVWAELPLIVWTVDRPARVAELLRAGVVAVITNLPAMAVAARRGWSAAG